MSKFFKDIGLMALFVVACIAFVASASFVTFKLLCAADPIVTDDYTEITKIRAGDERIHLGDEVEFISIKAYSNGKICLYWTVVKFNSESVTVRCFVNGRENYWYKEVPVEQLKLRR